MLTDPIPGQRTIGLAVLLQAVPLSRRLAHLVSSLADKA